MPERATASQPSAASAEVDALDLPFELSVGFLVRDIHRMKARMLQEGLERHGVAAGSWYYLRVLWQDDGLTQRQLSRRIGVNEATTRAAVDKMEADGLVRRAVDPSDRRKSLVCLTPKAKRLRPQLLRIALENNELAVMGFSASEVQKLLSMLGKIRRNLLRVGNGALTQTDTIDI